MSLCKCGCGEDAGVWPRTHTNRGEIRGNPRRYIHGHTARTASVTHGMSQGKEYQSWQHAKNRCTNPNYNGWARYGGRGIKFLFTSFEQFFAELGLRPEGKSLDRYPNNDGHYEPGNVRWATRKEQRENQRRKLSNQQISEIKERYAAGELQKILGKEFGVSPTWVSYLVREKK